MKTLQNIGIFPKLFLEKHAATYSLYWADPQGAQR